MPVPEEEDDGVVVRDGVDVVVGVPDPLDVGGLEADIESVTLELADVDCVGDSDWLPLPDNDEERLSLAVMDCVGVID